MKLLSVKVLGKNFRSIASEKLYEFNINNTKSRLSSKIFAGVNGSGKSNFLELLAEIFYYLEIYHLPETSNFEKKGNNFGFEIEYILPTSAIGKYINSHRFEETGCHVRISKPFDDIPEFSFCKYGDKNFERRDFLTEFLLPTKIIAYTSGQNELLSNPFLKIRYHYFTEIKKNFGIRDGDFQEKNNRLFFLDYNSNFSIFIANLLLAEPSKQEYLKKFFKVKGINSFRITINFVDYNKKEIDLSEHLLEQITKLKLCATTWIERREGREHFLVLDYCINQASLQAFDFHFKTAFNLFNAFYDLENLNLNLVKKDIRGLIRRADKSLNLSDEMSNPDPSRLVFRIEKIQIDKIFSEGGLVTTIYYKGLSDGEHQFNEVIGSVLLNEEEGCLFLMDEPDTHFNPKWRAKMIEMLNHVSATNIDSKGKIETVRSQEIILTTHSPFVISDSHTDDVYQFYKDKNGYAEFKNPAIQTYGASIGVILEHVFGRDASISDYSNRELEDIKEEVKNQGDVDSARESLFDFGESIEKFDALRFLKEKEKEYKDKDINKA